MCERDLCMYRHRKQQEYIENIESDIGHAKVFDISETKSDTFNVQEELEKEAAPMLISEQEEREYQEAQFCYVCHKKSLDLVKDHCHVLGTYRGK